MMKAPFPIVSRRRTAEGGRALWAPSRPCRAKLWADEEKRLNFYNWDTYIGETTVQTFTDKTGDQVQSDLFANNEELFAKLKEGNPGYDVIVPSDYMVQTMISAGHSRCRSTMPEIPNLKNLDPAINNPNYDPGMTHSVPYMWGTVGIGYRMSKVETPTAWEDVLDSDKYSGRIALLADSASCSGVALKYLGFLYEQHQPGARSSKARDLLIKQKKNIKAFAPDEGQNMLVAGDVDIVRNGTAISMQVMHDDKDLELCRAEGGDQPLHRQSRHSQGCAASAECPSPSSITSSTRRLRPRSAIRSTMRHPMRGARKLLSPEDAQQQDDLPAGRCRRQEGAASRPRGFREAVRQGLDRGAGRLKGWARVLRRTTHRAPSSVSRYPGPETRSYRDANIKLSPISGSQMTAEGADGPGDKLAGYRPARDSEGDTLVCGIGARKRRRSLVLGLPGTFWIVVFFTFPLVLIWIYSFLDAIRRARSSGNRSEHLTLDARRALWINLGIIWKSVWSGVIATASAS